MRVCLGNGGRILFWWVAWTEYERLEAGEEFGGELAVAGGSGAGVVVFVDRFPVAGGFG